MSSIPIEEPDIPDIPEPGPEEPGDPIINPLTTEVPSYPGPGA